MPGGNSTKRYMLEADSATYMEYQRSYWILKDMKRCHTFSRTLVWWSGDRCPQDKSTVAVRGSDGIEVCVIVIHLVYIEMYLSFSLSCYDYYFMYYHFFHGAQVVLQKWSSWSRNYRFYGNHVYWLNTSTTKWDSEHRKSQSAPCRITIIICHQIHSSKCHCTEPRHN